jgi:Ca2+-binding EF-hand superfamily protein
VDVTNHLLLSVLLVSAASPALPQAAAAPKGPQPVSRTVYMSRVDRGFSEIDTNKDGYVDRAEYESAEARAIATRRAQILKQRQAAFKQLDKDKSGSLSLTEFNSAVAAEPTRKPDATPRIVRLDTNKDGKVSMAESRAPANAQFDRLDTNKDGILSVEEQKKPAKPK